jgi:hypothetical protein
MGKILVALLILIIMALSFWAYKFLGSGGAANQKATYAEMQGIELDYRGNKISTPFVLDTSNGLRLAAFETGDAKFPYAWLALTLDNDEDANGVYQIGKAPPWKLTCAQIDALLAKEQTSVKVALFLRKQCNNNRGSTTNIP